MVIREKPKTAAKSALIELKSLDLHLLSPLSQSPLSSLRLEPDRIYTVGRSLKSCDFVVDSRFVSKQHFQILFDSINQKILIIDGGISLDGVDSVVDEFRRRLVCRNELERDFGSSRVRVSLNGVFVNGIRIRKGVVKELIAGDEILLGCRGKNVCNLGVKVGFSIRDIVFKEMVCRVNKVKEEIPDELGMMMGSQGTVSSGKGSKRVFADRTNDITLGCDSLSLKRVNVVRKANFLLNQCRVILRSDDPLSCIRQCDISGVRNKGIADDRVGFPVSQEEEVSSLLPVYAEKQKSSFGKSYEKGRKVNSSSITPKRRKVEAKHGLVDDSVPSSRVDKRVIPNDEPIVSKKEALSVDAGDRNSSANLCSPPGKKFYLNRLEFMDREISGHKTVSLPELLHPVETISQMFIATFTSDILWFLSYCGIPSNVPVTVACHNAERCWSSSHDSRISMPYVDYPNLVLVFPPFPEAIAFGNDRKRKGIACHHPKLFILQREDSIRVIITSANLVPKQWNSVTNTVWWQDFPRKNEPDYLSLFPLPGGETRHGTRSDFAAQLAGFVASLVVDVPSQAHWVTELTKYDFSGATGHLVASVPGIHSYRTLDISQSMQFMPANQIRPSSFLEKFLSLVEASVVGLSHLFRTAADSNGTQLKKLASFLGKSRENAYGMLDVVLRRNSSIPADENAVCVLVPNPDNLSGEDCVQLGFLPRNVAKWVSPLLDVGFFSFHGFIYRDEALAAAFEGNSKKVQLILQVSQGPCFLNISKLIQPQHVIALSSLIGSIQRCLGLWRLEEVLARYKWPESQESDFIYGASSIGAVNKQFIAAFASASGKRSSHHYDSEESDPEWGCWTASQELRNPSIRILYPTIDRVKNACSGIHPSKQILCFSEKTWQKLKTVDILHDSIPHPEDRIGHPMHTKVIRRRFWSKKGGFSSGWVYNGSHNFSAAAWGRPISSSRLHISNYEFGIVFVFPPTEKGGNLDDIVLPFVVPAPKYGPRDRPATPCSMRELLREVSAKERLVEAEKVEETMEEMLSEEDEDGEESCFVAEEKEDDKNYAEMLWIQVDSSQSS